MPTGVHVTTDFATYILCCKIRQGVQLDSIPNTTSGHLMLVYAFFCHKNENVYAFIVLCSVMIYLSVDTKNERLFTLLILNAKL